MIVVATLAGTLAAPACLLGAASPTHGSRLEGATATGVSEPVAPPTTARRLVSSADPSAVSRRAELWLTLAEEARAGWTSSLFSQGVASEGLSRRIGAGGVGDPSVLPSRPPDGVGEGVAAQGVPNEVQVVLEPGMEESDAGRLAAQAGLEVSETRRDGDGSLVATMRSPDDRASSETERRRAVEELRGAPGVIEMRVDAPSADDAIDGRATGAEGLSDVELLARELLGEQSPAAERAAEAGPPWRFLLGMLASAGLLACSGWLFWSSRQG